jgi:ketosteroid isomerase-like protein
LKSLKNSLSILLVLIALVSCKTDRSFDVETINGVLEGQARAWNSGNLEGYMTGYWMSDSLVFSGGKTISMGWHSALDRYKASYPTQEAMGNLNFSDLNLKFTSKSSAFSTGQWMLYRSSDTLSGRFTLVWQKKNGAWVIIADHSS